MSLQQRIKSMEYIVGQVRVGLGYKSSIHWVSTPFCSRDIVIRNLKTAFHESIVIIKLDPYNTWKEYPNKGSYEQDQESAAECVKYYWKTLGEKPEDTISRIDCGKLQPTGEIFRILHTPEILLQGRLLVRDNMPDTLTPEEIHKWRDDREVERALSGRYVVISPLDDRYPYVYVPSRSVPREFFKSLSTHYVEVEADNKWKRGAHPEGIIRRILHSLDDVRAEHRSLLSGQGFAPDVLSDDYVPEIVPPDECIKGWKQVAERVYLQDDGLLRHDVRGIEKMVSIDPETAKDLDDCLSVRSLGGDKILVGVHIADVSHYVKEGTALDIEARKRQTSVYMVGECVPMLPRALSERACSLNPGEPKFTYTCYWVVNYPQSLKQRRLVVEGEPFFHKTITQSVCRFSYGQALNIMEGRETEDDWSGFYPDLATKEEIRGSLTVLRQLHHCIRESRPNWVDLSREGSELKFRTDGRGKIVGVAPYITTDANKMIETWMVEANVAAGRIQTREMAILRSHKGFSEKRSTIMVEALAAVGVNISVKSKAALLASLNALPQHIRKDVVSAITFALEKAVYCMWPEADDFEDPIVEDQLKLMKLAQGKSATEALEAIDQVNRHDETIAHYGLDVPVYTHFTSPIRRYPDIMVHRQISEVLREYETPSFLETALAPSTRLGSPTKVKQEEEILPLPGSLPLLDTPKEGRKREEGKDGGKYGEGDRVFEEALLKDRSQIEDVLLHANDLKTKAGKVSRQSQVLHLNQYLKSLPEPVDCIGLVVNIQQKKNRLFLQIALDKIPVMVDDVALRIGSNECPFSPTIVETEYSEDKHKGSLTWNNGQVTELSLLCKFNVKLVYHNSCPPSSKIVILSPV